MDIGIKAVLYRLLIAIIKNILKIVYKNKVTNILIDAPKSFHFEHVRPLIKILAKNKNLEVNVVKWADFNGDDLEAGVGFIDRAVSHHKSTMSNIVGLIKFIASHDVYLTTEYKQYRPWMKGSVTTIFISHGVGLKISYIKNPAINKFDYIFSPGPAIKKLHSEIITDQSKIVKAGLPITDRIQSLKAERKDKNHLFPESRKKTILYAPSWSTSIDRISLNTEILEYFAKQSEYNVIIRPHPLLMKPEMCYGVNWSHVFNKMQSDHIYLHNAPNTNIYDVFGISDLMVTDISSTLYEFTLLNKPVIIYDPNHMFDFYQAQEEYLLLSKTVETVNDIENISFVLNKAIQNPDRLSEQRQRLVENTFYNLGHSSQSIYAEICSIIGVKI